MQLKYAILHFLLLPVLLLAQKEDNNWIMGAGQFDLGAIYKLNYINFTNDIFHSSLLNINTPFFGACAIISDASGNLLCYTNGINVYNKYHLVISNGANFQLASEFPFGYPFNQSVIILPTPESLGSLIMIDGVYLDIGTTIIFNKLRYSIIDIDQNNGHGSVIQKKMPIEYSSDTLNLGFLTSVKHGNGADWWVLLAKYQSNQYRKFLVTKTGVNYYDEQLIGDTIQNGVGYAAFSPSGCWYARYVAHGQTSNPKSALYLYRFDRNSGELSSPIHEDFSDIYVYGGVAFSPNSRYLYVARMLRILQYDLQAPDILASETVVAEYDGFLDENGVPTRFYGLQLAPDNKIYGNIPGFNSRYLHVIDQPNLPGTACNVIQHAIYLPAHNFGTLPNLPYFRLGAADISCDSLISQTYMPETGIPRDIRVWPVPAADVLYFSADAIWDEPLRLILFDAYGRPALDRRDIRLTPAATVPLDGLPPGVYFYNLLQRNGRVVKAGKVVRTK